MSNVLLKDGRLLVKNGAGKTAFNSDDGLFHPINAFSGSQAIAALSFADGTDYNLTTDYTVGTCNAACTDVIGSIKFTLGSQVAGMPFDRWQTLMGGAAIWVMDGHALTGTNPDPNLSLRQMIWYFFVIENGVVKLRRRAVNSQNSRGTYTVLSHTIRYKIKAGLFT